MKTIDSQFKRWKMGELTMLGSFQTKLFQAYQIADAENQLKLDTVFPNWFLDFDTSKERNQKSKIAATLITQMSQNLVTEIKLYLDQNGSLEFEDTVNLSFASEEMTAVTKRDNYYMILTADTDSGEEYDYEIDDYGCISIDDLIWILEQIENVTRER